MFCEWGFGNGQSRGFGSGDRILPEFHKVLQPQIE
jgi:hypothetical protein